MRLKRTSRHRAARALWLGIALVAGVLAVSGAHAQHGGHAPLGLRADGNPWGPSSSGSGSPPASPTPLGGVAVSFKSPQAGAPDMVIPGVLFKPAGQAKGAVVIIGAGGGVSNNREGHYARSLSSAGYSVLVIDSYSPRACHGHHREQCRSLCLRSGARCLCRQEAADQRRQFCRPHRRPGLRPGWHDRAVGGGQDLCSQCERQTLRARNGRQPGMPFPSTHPQAGRRAYSSPWATRTTSSAKRVAMSG